MFEQSPTRVGVAAIAVLLGLSLHAGCSGSPTGSNHNGVAPVSPTATQPGSQTPKVVFVLFDVSASVASPETRERYREAFRQIVDHIEGGDVLVADMLGDNPLAQSSFPVNVEFAPFEPTTDNDLLVRKQRQEFDRKVAAERDRAAELAEPLLAGPANGARRTHVLDALLLAERVFANYPRPRRVLVLFSDMIEDSERGNFAKSVPPAGLGSTTAESDRSKGRLPKLDGVRVYVVGAASTRPEAGASDQFLAVQRFWTDYLKVAGADVAAERYGAALVRFDE